MPESVNVRGGWLKFMYIYTIVGAGIFGLGIITIPNVIKPMFRLPSHDPVVFGILGSIYLSSGVLSIFGLRSPVKFVPILLLQLFYKSIWFVGVFLPLLISGILPGHAIMFAGIFVTYIIGNLIAIPFPLVFAKQSDR